MTVEADDSAGTMPSFSKADREGFAAFLLRARAQGYADPVIIEAMESVQRRGFVPAQFQSAAWSGQCVPIACGETLEGMDLQAQLLMAMRLGPKMRVLEIGTGSGFTAAVLSKLTARVYTIERFATLHHSAHRRLRALKIENVTAIHGDGAKGASDGPFERIIAWAAFEAIPRAFIEQLTSGGEMICAVGAEEQPQKIVRLTKVGSRFDAEELFDVRFQMLRPGVAKAL